MVLNKYKWVTILLAICFAVLQALQPFIHGHLDADHPIQHTGFHLGDAHEESLGLNSGLSPSELANHVVSKHTSHTVSVASGIKEDVNAALLSTVFFAVLLCLSYTIVLNITAKRYSILSLTLSIPPKRRLPAARAPPQF